MQSLSRFVHFLVVLLGVALSIASASSCGLPHTGTFIPNCLPSAETGPQAVAKVRYTITWPSGTTKTETTALGQALELTPDKDSIKLPLVFELLNSDDVVLATHKINDPELVGRSAKYPLPKSDDKDPKTGQYLNAQSPFRTVVFVSAQGNRYQDSWEYNGQSATWSLKRRIIHFTDVDSAAIACATLVTKPSPWPAAPVAAFVPAVLNLAVGESKEASVYLPNADVTKVFGDMTTVRYENPSFTPSGIAEFRAGFGGGFYGKSPGTTTFRTRVKWVGPGTEIADAWYDVSLTINVKGVVASLQGLTQTGIGSQATKMVLGSTYNVSQVTNFIQAAMSQHAGHNLALDASKVIWESWERYGDTFKDVGSYTIQFKSANGEVWKGADINGGIWKDGVAPMFWQFPVAVPERLYEGDQAKGRLEMIFPFANGQNEIVVYSQDFVLAEKATAGAVNLRLKSSATHNATANQVVVTSNFPGGAVALYDRLNVALGGILSPISSINYGELDAKLASIGVTIESHFQKGTVTEGEKPILVTYGSPIPLVKIPTSSADMTINPSSDISVNLTWPSAADFALFKNVSGPQTSVTGYLTRTLKYQGRTVATLIGSQVTWATETKELIASRQSSSGGGGGGAVAQPAPTVTSLSSTSGGGLGTTITITGTNFRAPATVKFGAGAVLGTGLTVNSATSITVTLPTLAAGAHAVVVTNTDNNTTGTSPTPYTVTAPTITGIAPNNGLAGSATTITGTNFRAGATVTIGGVGATVTGNTGTTLTVTVPAQAAGAKNVVVTNTDSTSVTSVGGYTVNAGGGAPTIDAVGGITPDGTMGGGPWVTGQPYTITGTNLTGATISVGGVNVPVTTDTATQLDGTIPGGLPSGNQTLEITTGGGTVTHNFVFVP